MKQIFFKDVITYIYEDATDAELARLEDIFFSSQKNCDNSYPSIRNVQDERKLKYMVDIFNKFTLEELEEKLGITYNP